MFLNFTLTLIILSITISLIILQKSKLSYNRKVLFFDTSLFFDQLFNLFNQHNCQISKKIFNQYLHTSKQLLKEINYQNAKIIIINRVASLTYDSDGNYNLCQEYHKFCDDSKYLWAKINMQFGKRLPDNLVRNYDENGNLFLFKTYKCHNNELLIIGVVLK